LLSFLIYLVGFFNLKKIEEAKRGTDILNQQGRILEWRSDRTLARRESWHIRVCKSKKILVYI
jgi:hypothetical protein